MWLMRRTSACTVGARLPRGLPCGRRLCSTQWYRRISASQLHRVAFTASREARSTFRDDPKTHRLFIARCVRIASANASNPLASSPAPRCRHFGSKDDMSFPCGGAQSNFASIHNYPTPRLHPPAWRHAVTYVLHDASKPEFTAVCHSDPHLPWTVDWGRCGSSVRDR